MRILHTSDWHLGRSLYGRKRYEEFSSFLDWLAQTIEDEKVDALLIAGDVFDTSTPSNRAQELYYRFLCRVATSCCRHVVVVAGNHDSPSFLNAPKELLRALNVYVVGSMTEALEDEVFVLHADDKPEAIVCAVPYLRDKDIRTVEPGETIDDKNAKLVEGLKNHYADVCAIAEQKRAEFKSAGHEGISPKRPKMRSSLSSRWSRNRTRLGSTVDSPAFLASSKFSEIRPRFVFSLQFSFSWYWA
jgi:exonuclease SbcD